MRSPVRGGLKGGRRSVKRGQSVEFADYRDYAPRRRPAPARLERLRPPREAVRQAVHRGGGRHRHPPGRRVGVDGRRAPGEARCSPSARRRPSATSGWPARTGSRSARWPGASPGAGRRCAARAGSSGCWPTCPRIEPADGPTDLVAAARHAAAQLHGRGVVVLLSRPARPGGRPGHPRARRDGLRADRPARPVARRARSAARGRPAPGRRGDGRRHRHHRRPRDDRRLQGAPRRLEGGLRRPRRQAPGELRGPRHRT